MWMYEYRAIWAGLSYKRFWLIIINMLFKTVMPYAPKNLKNKAIFNLKQYCMHWCDP